jgi:hypothetical protein
MKTDVEAEMRHFAKCEGQMSLDNEMLSHLPVRSRCEELPTGQPYQFRLPKSSKL